MKVCILHHDLEDAEKGIRKLLEKKGFGAELVDVRNVTLSELLEADLVLTRVYASVANRDYPSIKETLALLEELEKNGVHCLNSHRTSIFDYSKYDSYKVLKEQGIFTPETAFISEKEQVKPFAKDVSEKYGFPIVLKRNTGGRGKDISRVANEQEFVNDLTAKFELAEREGYRGGFVAQEFIRSSREYDCRVGIADQKFAFSYKRSLVPRKQGESPWLASMSNGSVEGEYEAQNGEVELALKSSECIGADFNELDIMFTEKGPCIIENNPTPNYFVNSPSDQEEMRLFVESVINHHLRK